MRNALLTLIAPALVAGVPCQAQAADLYVVVHASNTLAALSPKEAVALFTGRTRAFPNGETSRPYDHPQSSAAREDFYRALTGMDLARINSYWSRLQFSGQLQPPKSVASNAEMTERIKRDPHAIGYLTVAPKDPDLRVVLVIKAAEPTI